MSPRTTGLHTLSRCPRGRTGQHNQRRMVVAMAAEGAMGRAHLAPADTVHYPGRTPASRRPGPHPRVHKSQRPGTRRKKKGEGSGSEPRSVRLQSRVGTREGILLPPHRHRVAAGGGVQRRAPRRERRRHPRRQQRRGGSRRLWRHPLGAPAAHADPLELGKECQCSAGALPHGEPRVLFSCNRLGRGWLAQTANSACSLQDDAQLVFFALSADKRG